MKPFAITLDPGTSLANHTGSWRTNRPVYAKRIPPCNKACPAGENIQEWLSFAETGNYKAAWQALVKNNPFPATMGRICYHSCENACNRKEIDAAVNINSVECFIGDEAIRNNWQFNKPGKSSGKKVMVVGSGPSGLSAAYHLAMLGHNVTIFESSSALGGMMRYGIPRYRLPGNVLDAEIQRIIDLEIEVRTNTNVTDVLKKKKDGGYDAVYMAVGAHIAKTAPITAKNGAIILDAISVLRKMEESQKPSLGKRVIVYGGGNTAIDVARTARRLGSSDVTVVYRRTREKMPAHNFEIDEALQEGIKIKYLSTIKSASGTCVTIEQMELDEKGMPRPTGKSENMDADCILLALGQDADLSLTNDIPNLSISDNMLDVDERLCTGHEGIFAGGDMTSSLRTATVAIGHGKKAARHIDGWLRGVAYTKTDASLATVDRLNTWYYSKTIRNERSKVNLAQRVNTFDEVQIGLSEDATLQEARRCLSCGNCFECDNCYSVCPDSAIQKLGPGQGFAINYNYCKGCGLCAVECPCGAIDILPEEN